MLAWARHPSQYASFGSWLIRPAYQMYKRSVRDHMASLLAEPTVCLWDIPEADADCRLALRAVRQLKALRFEGPQAVRNFQAAAGLVADGIPGPHTLGALGIS
jgi:murein L,D-transpeptidase YcbB/YkuD